MDTWNAMVQSRQPMTYKFVEKHGPERTMNIDTNFIKIGQELRKLLTIKYFNIGVMGATILNI